MRVVRIAGAGPRGASLLRLACALLLLLMWPGGRPAEGWRGLIADARGQEREGATASAAKGAEGEAPRVIGTMMLPDSLHAFVLGEIIVTADRWRQGLPVRGTMVTQEELQQTPGRSASDVLRSLPGVVVSAGRKDEASITVRGFGARRVAIMVDGRPMNIPYYGTFNLASVDAGNLEKVMVVRGPASVTFGPNVMGGVVNFVTARGRERPGTRLRVTGGSHNTGEVHLTHGRVMGAWDLLVSLRGGGTDGTPLPRDFRPTGYPGTEDGDYRDNSDRVTYDAFAKLGYRDERGTDVAFSCGYLDTEKGVPGAIDEERYWRFTDWRRYFGDLTLTRKLGREMTLKAKGYGDVFVNTLVDYEDATYDLDAVFYNSTHHNWDLGGIVALEHAWSERLRATHGLSVREDQIKKRMNPEDPWLYHHQVTGSLYSEHHWRMRGTLWASLGVADHFMIHNHLRDVEHVPGFDAGVTAHPAPEWALFGSIGQGSRFPTLNQLWSTGSGNRDLRPEVTRRFEVGADWQPHETLQSELTLFYNDLRDLIDRDVYRAGRYFNIHSAHSYGLELVETLRWGDWLALEGAYTYTEAENRDTDDPLDLIPEHKLDGRVIVSPAGGHTRWTLVVSHVGSRYDSESLAADKNLPAYTVLDCQVRSQVTPRLAMTLEVMNIGDVHYEEEVMYPAPGRTVLIHAAVDF